MSLKKLTLGCKLRDECEGRESGGSCGDEGVEVEGNRADAKPVLVRHGDVQGVDEVRHFAEDVLERSVCGKDRNAAM